LNGKSKYAITCIYAKSLCVQREIEHQLPYAPNKKAQAKPQPAASYLANPPAQAADQDDPA
jgi:hypothetical protein